MKFSLLSKMPKKAVIVFVQSEQTGLAISAAKVALGDEKQEDVAWTNFESAEELVKKMGKHLPYVVQVNGFGVLTRKVENTPNFKEGLLVSGNETEFYFTDFELKGSIAVSFIRKSVLAPFISEMEKQKVFIQGIFVGPIPFLPKQPAYFKLNSEYSIEIQNGSLVRLERNTETEEPLHETMKRRLNDLSYDLEKEGYHQGISEDVIIQSAEQYKQYLRFVRLGISVLGFFLVSLICNYFYVNYLNQKAAELEAEISAYGPNFSMIEQLKGEKSRKLILIENSGIQSKQYISFFLDEIGVSVPSSISLNDLETFPLKEPLKPKKKMELESTIIKVSGECQNSKVLDDWMEKLEERSWIQSVELMNYIRVEDQLATFELKLNIRQ